jgi:hypothetical protein
MNVTLIQDDILQFRASRISKYAEFLKILSNMSPGCYVILNNSIFVEKEAYDNLVNRCLAPLYTL